MNRESNNNNKKCGQCACCSLRSNRLSRIAIAIVSTFLLSAAVSMMVQYIDVGTQEVTPLKDFIIFLPVFLYSSFCNGFAICYSSRTYQSMLKNIICCKYGHSIVSFSASRKSSNNLSRISNEGLGQDDSCTLPSTAVLEMSCA